jgi:hypothetical protein
MQERVDQAAAENNAQHGASSWYLLRGGAQHGPLSDRELSLFAEGGNFKEGDLLWTAGLDTWKPAEALFGLGSSSEADTQKSAEANGETAGAVFNVAPSSGADTNVSFALSRDVADAVFDSTPSPAADTHEPLEHPNGEHVDALVQALHASTQPPKLTLKERVIGEAKKFAGIVLYLWAVFIVFLLHEWVVLSEHHIGFKFYGLAMINAVLLGKIMLVAENFHFAEQLNRKPLVYPIVYKSVAFTTLLFVAYIVEEMLFGVLGGNGLAASVPAIGGGTVLGFVLLWCIFCLVLIPFFAFKEIERAVGPDMLRALLFGRS